jgi:hypothetical protein
MSHYIPYFAVEASVAYNPNAQPSRYLRAVCGAVVPFKDHTIEPTCPKCAAWLEADAKAECPF